MIIIFMINYCNMNKIFAENINLKDQKNLMVSHMRQNREYLLSNYTAYELNTYLRFNPFRVFNDGYVSKYSPDGKEELKPTVGPGTPGVRSIFNKYGAVVIGTSSGNASRDQIINDQSSSWRVSNNTPLMDNRSTRIAIRQLSNCTIKDLVRDSSNGLLGRAMYDFSDFMYCKYLGKISNNYLITLRRFPLPVDDYISTIGINESVRKHSDIASKNSQPIGCLVNWIGTPGNEMSNILKYSFKMPFGEHKAELQDIQASGDSQSKMANGIAAMFDPVYRQQYMAGQVGESANHFINKFFKVNAENGPYSDVLNYKDNNKVYGPVDVIKHTYMRSEDGLEFNQDITLVFDYELRSYNGINGRQAMLDLLSNILNVTYTTGTFWGGGYRGTGAHQNNIFANMKIFQGFGGFTEFADKFSQDLTDITKSFRDSFNLKYGGDFMSMIKSAANQLGGMLIAGQLNKLGRPAKQAANSLLSPAPVGFWHVTIGNPYHPIMSIGNMILKNTTIEHYGPLGLDDFPTGIKVTCELTRGKPRDIRDIEKLYMHGNDRIYTSMGPKVLDMYDHAIPYKSTNNPPIPTTLNANKTNELSSADNEGPSITSNTIEIQDMKKHQSIISRAFGGQSNTESICLTASEMEIGAFKKKNKS